jgi:hypothetical protein
MPRKRERHSDPAWSKTLRTHASFSHGNRDILRLVTTDGVVVRAVNSMKHDGNARSRKSDSSIVPKKLANKDPGAPRSAEEVEGRESGRRECVLQNRF